MEKKKQIGEHIVDHLSERMNEEIVDPVLDEWLAEDESNQEDFKRYKEIWKETGSYLEQKTFNAQYAWDKIDRINKERDNKRKRLVNIGYIISGVAATLLLVLGFSKMGVFDKQPEMLVRMTADYGSRSEVVLPDGSVVKLNSGSDITYSYNAKENIREVNFQGEGFFDVSKNKIPFVIKMSNGLRLKVHGTSFNLQAYTDEKTVEASLVEGCIELDHGNEKLLMNAGDMAVFPHLGAFAQQRRKGPAAARIRAHSEGGVPASAADHGLRRQRVRQLPAERLPARLCAAVRGLRRCAELRKFPCFFSDPCYTDNCKQLLT